ncbi:Putative NAD(P)H nitroreductase YdjA [Pseudidiomarina piscicola]|uniref:Putative NAD(P)H nitroreductase n=1 Tax=Pseudidiomarina piscicola TaxID=2614830 RepID=A0A6S6WJU1_9GAMM|nr:nitroreductase family protein [Pseudidiomarina piscicola]CAB0149919.1 Putative NAD(P)H nitroreductase YdjA [Pseudidiomarina piscicola]VZT39366.1 Putative NAD(P)H nitroreductase YdjA [Pseudomonas aeruginosa]
MQALELLTTRSSMPRLIEPAPSSAQFELMQRAAGRAPDHMALMPYRFVVFEKDARHRLGDIYRAAAQQKGLSDDACLKASQLPLRAPMVIACLLDHQGFEKVPRDEQFASAACATLLMQQAAFAQNLGAIWRTGWFAEDELVLRELGGKSDDAVVGFLYVGTPAVPTPIKPDKAITEKFSNG